MSPTLNSILPRGEDPEAPALASVALPDGELSFRRKGEGASLLWLHGTHFAGVWLPFHETVSASCDLIAPVHPGFAEGVPPRWLGGFDDLVLHYRDLLDTLGLSRVHVAGHALGGWLAANIAIFCPERVASLTLVTPLGLRVPGKPMTDFMAVDPNRIGELLFNDDAAAFAALLPDFDDPYEFARFYGENGVTARLIWERRYDLKLERRLPRVTVPAHVISPTEDRLLPVEHGARWVELLPHARHTVLSGVGHGLIAQDPHRSAAAVVSSLQEVTVS